MIVFVNLPLHNLVLERYATYQECQVERNRIGLEMAKAYPESHDFDVVCRFKVGVI